MLHNIFTNCKRIHSLFDRDTIFQVQVDQIQVDREHLVESSATELL